MTKKFLVTNLFIHISLAELSIFNVVTPSMNSSLTSIIDLLDQDDTNVLDEYHHGYDDHTCLHQLLQICTSLLSCKHHNANIV